MSEKTRKIEDLAYKLHINGSEEISRDVEFTRLTTHLDYLDEKIFKILSLYTQVAIAAIGSTFFLSTLVLDDPTLWANAVSELMITLAIVSFVLIIHHLFAWKKYRNKLTQRFPFTGKPNWYWWVSEVVQCVLIIVVSLGFLHYNPLLPENYKQMHGNKDIATQAPPSVTPPALHPISPTEVSAKSVIENVPINFIRNGLFNYLLTSPDSAWGTGLYSDRFLNNDSSHQKKYWINFSGADIQAFPVPTPRGNALKIVNRSGKRPDVVGVMEQRINTFPGAYELSFLAKGERDLEDRALQICTTDDWAIVGSDGQTHGLEITKNGPFEWERFKTTIEITQPGPITLSIVSKGAGTIYLTDFSLTRAPDSGKG